VAFVSGPAFSKGEKFLESDLADEPNEKTATAIARLQELESKRIITSLELAELCSLSTQEQFVIENMIPAQATSIIVGDSGLGKSPLAYQIALSVASGREFCHLPVRKSPVLMIDLENSATQADEMVESLCKFMSLPRPPELLRLNADFPSTMEDWSALWDSLKDMLIIVDSLRAAWPLAPEKNAMAATLLQDLKAKTRKNNLSFILVHHLRKPGTGDDTPPALKETSLIEWLNQASGARSLVNQSDGRIGVTPDGQDRLLMKSKMRVHDEFDWVLVREYDETGSPAGYRMEVGLDTIGHASKVDLLKLPDAFRFAEARDLLGKKGGSLVKFLEKCIRAGVLERADGGYRKPSKTVTAAPSRV